MTRASLLRIEDEVHPKHLAVEVAALLGGRSLLFANWCTDPPDMDDPSPAVEFVWPIVEGTLTFDGATEMDCGNDEVTVHAIGLVAQRSDGERIEIGDLDITTASWAASPVDLRCPRIDQRLTGTGRTAIVMP
jgi:hypothetical protein